MPCPSSHPTARRGDKAARGTAGPAVVQERVFCWFLLLLMRRPRPIPARAGWKVGVATTFVPGAESLEMLEETVRALVAMEYPHETWVLDEGDEPQVRAL